MDFIKLHGTGNDFIFVDTRKGIGHAPITSAQAAFLCRRNFGIGADGVLSLYDVLDGKPCMRIHNADGSVAEMCGNGLRCFVKVLVELLGFTDNPLTVVTDDGEKTCRHRMQQATTHVAISMGGVRDLSGARLLSVALRAEQLSIAGTDVEFYSVSTGNPHAVLAAAVSREAIELLGPALSCHPCFPSGANVGFPEIRSETEIDLVVYERGVGLTLACGTGAVAAAAVAVALGRCPAGEPIGVNLPGGRLSVLIAEGFVDAELEGPAVEVFSGRLELPEIR